LEKCSPGGQLLGLDIDPNALDLSKESLQVFEQRTILVHASFTTLLEQIYRVGWEYVQGILLDLGISSMQIDSPERGFSFLHEGPLDMRFNPAELITAADLVNDLPFAQLADIIWQYGQERYSRKISRAICDSRPIHTTKHLVEVITKVIGRRREKIHPATRTFQALRIIVNRELEAIEKVLPQIIESLSPGGRAAVISFHSLEDRIVKHYFRRESQDCICPDRQPVCTCEHIATVRQITRRPIRPKASEIELNPRARSARLRVVEKV
jgi:16S rRNA (cytosine1402-N4)-methyltransferase